MSMEERNSKRIRNLAALVQEWTFPGRRERFHWFLKSPKATNRNRSIFSIDIVTKKGLVIQKGDFDLFHLSETQF